MLYPLSYEGNDSAGRSADLGATKSTPLVRWRIFHLCGGGSVNERGRSDR